MGVGREDKDYLMYYLAYQHSYPFYVHVVPWELKAKLIVLFCAKDGEENALCFGKIWGVLFFKDLFGRASTCRGRDGGKSPLR